MSELLDRESMAVRLCISVDSWDKICNRYPSMPCVSLGKRMKRWNPSRVIEFLERVTIDPDGQSLQTRPDVVGAIHGRSG